MLLAVALLCVGQNAWAVDVPTPVYFNDFSSTDGLTIVGSGEFIIDGDSRFGKIYQNDPQNTNSVRTNYLVLPSDVLSHSATSREMTIGFWVNKKNEGTEYQFYPLFAAYTGAPRTDNLSDYNQTSNENGMPMFVCQSRGLLQYNNEQQGGSGSWCNFDAAQNDAESNLENNSWCFDGQWHYYTVTLTETSAKVYLDGNVVNAWTLDNTTDGQKLTALLTNTTLTYVTLGGNQAWGWNDPDPAFGFDDFAVYDEALSAEQIGQVINNKLVQDATLLEYGTNDVPWTTGRVAEWTAGGSPTLADGIVTISGGDGSYETSKTISPAAGNIINLTAVWRGASSTGRNFSKSNGSYFRFGNIIVAQNDQDQKHGYGFTGLTNIASVTTFSAGRYRVDVTSSTWLKIEAEINTATNTLTTFTIKSEDGATTYVNLSNQALTSPDYTTIAFGYKRSGSVTTTNKEQLKSIKITQTVPSATYADYTVHFKDNNGATVKEDEVRNGEVGETVNANNVDKETFYNGGNKYTYKSDGDGVEVVAAGTAELTVVYDKHEGFTATASAVSGGSTIKTNIASVSGYEGETKTLQLHKYIEVGGTWYSTASCYIDVTEGGDNEVTYTPTAAKYFYEFESFSGGRTDETDKSYSGGVRSRVNKSNSLSTPEEIAGGVYTLTIPYSNSNSTAGKLYLYTVKGGVETDTELTIDCPNGNGTVSKTVTIPDGAALRFKNTNASYSDNGRIDYLTLTPRVPVEVSAAGYATYVNSDYDLDFSATSIEAYKVKVSSKGVATMTKVDNVPANTPVLLYKEGGATENIPVMTGATDDKENDLVAGTGDAVATTDGGYTNMILNVVDEKIGFYFANGWTVAANRAYLHIATTLAPDPVLGARMAMRFAGDNITAVENVEAAAEAKAKEGKFIENGKLVIVKNGVKFNAAGAKLY